MLRPASASFFRWIPRIQLVVQTVLLFQAVRIAPSLSWSELVVFGFAVGLITGGVGITIAHELTHRASRMDRVVAKALLVSVGYGHFTVEHVRGHHVRVGTPDDPATAPRGMSVYRFVVRSVLGSFRHAWRLEAMRLEHEGRSPWSLRNWVLTGTLLSVLLLATATAFGGLKAACLFSLQAAWAVVLLEVINYIEHYGLQRNTSTAAMNRCAKNILGTPITRSATGCCSTCSCTPIITPTCGCRTSSCAQHRPRPSCLPAIRR